MYFELPCFSLQPRATEILATWYIPCDIVLNTEVCQNAKHFWKTFFEKHWILKKTLKSRIYVYYKHNHSREIFSWTRFKIETSEEAKIIWSACNSNPSLQLLSQHRVSWKRCTPLSILFNKIQEPRERNLSIFCYTDLSTCLYE
jgi:hypothetical protein